MFGFNKRKPKAGLDADLTAVSNSISGSLTSVDPHFLMLGEKLNETFSASEQLSGLVLNTLNLDQAGEDKNRLKDIHTVSDTAIQHISQDYERFRENSSAARGPAERFTHLLSWAKAHLSFMPEFAETLENQNRALDKILSSMSEADMGSPEKIPEASIYSMESERLIHSEVVGGNAKMIPPDVKDPPKDEKKRAGFSRRQCGSVLKSGKPDIKPYFLKRSHHEKPEALNGPESLPNPGRHHPRLYFRDLYFSRPCLVCKTRS